MEFAVFVESIVTPLNTLQLSRKTQLEEIGKTLKEETI
jgi:hypothetical protein